MTHNDEADYEAMIAERAQARARAAALFLQLSGSAKEVLGQLFITGPQWDGYVASKTGRDELRDLDLIERGDGWQWLTRAGMVVAVNADVKHWADQRWYKKQCM